MPRTNCSVIGCKSNKKLQQKGIISFHCFPKDIKVRKVWLKFCGLDEVNDSYVVCSKHFKKKYFENCLLAELTEQNLKRRLRKNAKPTEYPPPLVNRYLHQAILNINENNTDSGYQRSSEEINTRIKNLKCFYNRIKKELANGSTTEPTWKHYQAMDEIMTRAIFSVRPNEIPKPSLRYRLEEEKRAREENDETTEKISDDNEKLSIADEDDDDDYDNDIEIGASNNNGDVNSVERNSGENSNSTDDNLNTMECEEEKPELKELEKFSAAKIQEININNNANNNNNSNKNNNNNETNKSSEASNITEESPVIKNEPIDIDDDDEEDKTTTTAKKTRHENLPDLFPFSDYLKLSAVNNMPNAKKIATALNNSNAVITTIESTITNKESNAITTSNVKQISQPKIILNSSSPSISSSITSKTATNPQGKISLVPTNFLLKSTPQPQPNIPVPSTIQLRPRPNAKQPQQHHIIYTQNPTIQPNVQNGIVNTNSGSMQVLLVNAVQNGASQQNIATSSIQTIPDIANKNSIFSAPAATATQITTPSMQSKQNNLSHQTKTTTVNLSNMVSAASMEKINLINASSSTKSPTGYRALLGQLVKNQSENNEIQRQRLRIERERLEFEKSVVERFFNTVPIWLSSLQQPAPDPNSSKNKSAATKERNDSREKSNSLDDNACVSIPIKMEKDIE